jgi:hypothetical protein
MKYRKADLTEQVKEPEIIVCYVLLKYSKHRKHSDIKVPVT